MLGLCFLGCFFSVLIQIFFWLTREVEWLPTPLVQLESLKPEKFRKENQVVVYTQSLIMHSMHKKQKWLMAKWAGEEFCLFCWWAPWDHSMTSKADLILYWWNWISIKKIVDSACINKLLISIFLICKHLRFYLQYVCI